MEKEARKLISPKLIKILLSIQENLFLSLHTYSVQSMHKCIRDALHMYRVTRVRLSGSTGIRHIWLDPAYICMYMRQA